MLLDILLGVALILGFLNGFRRGLIRALFAFIGLFFGVLFALKYSYVVSDYLYREALIQSKLLPLFSFIGVFLVIILLVTITARIVEGMAESMLFGVVNKIIGGLLEAAIVLMVFSTLIWYLDKLHFISSEMRTSSASYQYLITLSPAVIAFVSQLLPFFNDVFQQLEQLFEKVTPPPREGSIKV